VNECGKQCVPEQATSHWRELVSTECIPMTAGRDSLWSFSYLSLCKKGKLEVHGITTIQFALLPEHTHTLVASLLQNTSDILPSPR
jgi:hypothetical protein